MHYLYFFLYLTFVTTQSFALGFDYEYCKNHRAVDQCDVVMAKYWWGEKFDELNKQIKEFKKKLQKAVKTDDYSEIYPYLQLPVSFYIEDLRETVSSRSEGKSYEWKANTNEEFKTLFKKVLKLDNYSYESILSGRVGIIYYDSGSVDVSYFVHILLKTKCNKFVPSKKKRFLNLPQDLDLCEVITLKIKSVATTL